MEGYLKCAVEKLDKAAALLFLNTLTLELQLEHAGAEERMERERDILSECENLFLFQVLNGRLEAFKSLHNPDLAVGLPAKIFCSGISANPADAVMWAYTLNEIFCKEQKPVTLEMLVMTYFSTGLPTQAARCAAWDAQKVVPDEGHTDNAVDNFDNWPRLPPKPEKEVA